MIKLYITDISDLPDPKESPEVLSGLSSNRVEKILRCKDRNSRKQSLGAGLLLSYALKEEGIEETEIEYGLHGKPLCKNAYFNLSHSNKRVICAFGKTDVGCDIEFVKPYNEGLAGRFFCENERAWLEGLSVVEREKGFFRLWSAKESYMKYTGEGFSLSTKAFSVDMDDSNHIYRNGEKHSCIVHEINFPDYCISICSEERTCSEPITVKSKDLLR